MVAIVDGERIFESAVDQRMAGLISDIEAIHDPAERERTLATRRGQVVEQIVDERIATEEAHARHITASENDVDLAVRALANQQHATVDEVYATVQQLGMTREAYRDVLRSEVLRLRVLQLVRRPHLDYSDADVAAAYESMPSPRPPLDQVRAELRERMIAARAECDAREWMRAARDRHHVQFLIERAEPEEPTPSRGVVRADHVYFMGNTSVPTDRLRAALPHGETVTLEDEGTLPHAAIEAMYPMFFEAGHLSARITNAPERVDACDPRVDHAVVEIEEGPRFRVGTIDAQELDAHDHPVEPPGGRAAVHRLIHLRPHEWFSRTALYRDLDAIRALYRAHGYSHADVSPMPTPHTDTIDIMITVRRGEADASSSPSPPR